MLDRLLIQNNIAGSNTLTVKQENITDEGPPSVTSATSSGMSHTEEATTVQQTDGLDMENHENVHVTTADGQTIQLKNAAVTQAIITQIASNGCTAILPRKYLF